MLYHLSPVEGATGNTLYRSKARMKDSFINESPLLYKLIFTVDEI